jgi:hypothetical protein
MNVISMSASMLNFWVAKSVGLTPVTDLRGADTVSVANAATGALEPYQPVRDWSQAGPIVAAEWYEIETVIIEWLGPHWPHVREFADDPLLWFMRALVVIHFGDEVED